MKTLQRVATYNTTPEGYNGGIWMSGQGPAADDRGNLYLSVGNGSVGAQGNPRDPVNRGESLLRLQWDGKLLHLTDWFTPANWQDLENTDNDFGNSGVLLIPGTTLAFCGSKEGKVYLVNYEQMGGLSHSAQDTNIVQSLDCLRRRSGGTAPMLRGLIFGARRTLCGNTSLSAARGNLFCLNVRAAAGADAHECLEAYWPCLPMASRVIAGLCGLRIR
jgi:hypothetical protein